MMRKQMLVFAVLVAVLGSLSTDGDKGNVPNEPVPPVVKVESRSEKIQNYKGTEVVQVGKKSYSCNVNINYYLSGCGKSTARCKPNPKKVTIKLTIDTGDAIIAISVQKNKVKGCKVEPITIPPPPLPTTTATTTQAPDPVDCSFSNWSTWSACSESCGGGVQTRERRITQEALHGGDECSGESSQEQQCAQDKCPGSYEDDMLEQLELSSAFANTNMTQEDKESCKKELKGAIKTCQETEESIGKLRFKKPFIRSTELTDRLGRDSRLFNALKEAITRVSSDWTSPEGGKIMTEFFSQNFQKWAEKGGGLSILEPKTSSRTEDIDVRRQLSGPDNEDVSRAGMQDRDVTCDVHHQYRRIDGKCNNLANKHQGSAGTALKRFLPSRYDVDSCPNNWTKYQTGCYIFVEAKKFDEAVEKCKEIGGFLAEIRSQNEQINFRQFAENSGYINRNIWLGAKRGQNDKWVWINSNQEMTYANWNSGNPDNSGGNENCLSAWGSDGSGFQWNNQTCNRDDLSDLALCQQSGVSTPRGGFSTLSLPSARVVSRKNHHKNNPNPLTSKGITLMVMQFGQFLDHDLSLTADMEFVENLAKKITELEAALDTKCDATTCSNIQTTVTDIAYCPSGWSNLATGCYKFIDKGTHQQAIANCKNEGGFLVEIDDQEEFDNVFQFYKDDGISDKRIWLGATDNANEGEWIWSNSGKKLTFTAWNIDEPNNYGGPENCLEADGDLHFKWNDYACTASRKGLCEFDAKSPELIPRLTKLEESLDAKCDATTCFNTQTAVTDIETCLGDVSSSDCPSSSSGKTGLAAALNDKCDANTCEALGWTIIQRRGQFGNAKDYFNKDFNDYEVGFGSVDDEFWFGLKKLAALTSDGQWEMQVDLADWDDKVYHIRYKQFSVGPAPTYKLNLPPGGSVKEEFGDSALDNSMYYHHGQAFSARDKDQDGSSVDCAGNNKGGWWYFNPGSLDLFLTCKYAHLNGLNFPEQTTDPNGIKWHYDGKRGKPFESFKASVMKIRKVKV